MDIVTIVGFALVAAAVSMLLKQYKPEYAVVVATSASCMLLIVIITTSLPIIDEIRILLENVGAESQYVEILVKALGICYISQLASDTCKDMGEASLASKIELAAKITVLVLALPMFNQMIYIVTKLIG